MDQKMFSDSLEVIANFKTENPALQDSLSYLASIVGDDFKIRHWSENRIAIPVKLKVELPSVANHDNLDIRAEEQVIIVFDGTKYPGDAPMVFTDRLDFPKDKLAHLYIAKNGKTPAFCYIRGDMDQWYANKTIKDLIIRIKNWLRDAATGELSENGEQFDPLRLEGFSGMIVYDYNAFADVVSKNQALTPEMNFALALFQRIKDAEATSFRFLKFATMTTFKEVMTEFEEEKKKDKEGVGKRQLHYGYVLWSENEQTQANYNISWPTKWSEFKTFCQGYGINTDLFETFVCTLDPNYYLNFPVILAIKRPKQLIGYSSNIEFANFRFRIDTDDVAEGKVITDFEVKFQAHNQPLSPKLAAKISRTEQSKGIKAIYGCGALGSKVGLHFGRSGNHPLVFSDPDTLSSHNLVRHGLLSDQVGKNKGKALADEIKAMFPAEKVLVAGGESSPDFVSADKFKSVTWLFDFTASPAFFNQLILAKNIDHVGVASSNISDFGNLGITLVEGQRRNPRIDDLQVSLYALNKVDTKIREWLQREDTNTEKQNISVSVGVGCNSETTVLPDVNVSSHAAFAAAVLEREMVARKSVGTIFLNRITEVPHLSIETSRFEVPAFDVFVATNDKNWSIRFRGGIVDEMRKGMVQAKNKETGGVFVGVANFKTKVIHVTDVIPAPPDSQANAVCFYRGVKGLPDTIASVTKNSGNQLGYIGEWHSHPHGPNGLSEVDLASVAKFKAEFDSLVTPLPVFLTVITPTHFLPFVF